MKEEPKIYSDGIVETFFQGRYYFAGHGIDDLIRKTLTEFARNRVGAEEDIVHDHRLLYWSESTLTPELVDRYLHCRKIYDISIILNSKGGIDAEVCFLNNPQT